MGVNRAAELDAALFYGAVEGREPQEFVIGRAEHKPASQHRPSFWRRIFGIGASPVGLDVGTRNTVISVDGASGTFSEPSVVAVRDGRIVAAGKEAREMIGRTPKGIEVLHPLRQGVVADFDLAREMIRIFLKRGLAGAFSPGHIAVAIPGSVTDVDRRALEEAILQAGASKVTLVDETLAAAIGSGCDVNAASGRFVVSIGAGVTQASVISLGEVVHAEVSPVAGAAIDEAIARHLESGYKFLIGSQTAEEIKIALASAMPEKEERTLSVQGRGVTGPPRSLEIASDAVAGAIGPVVDEIVSTTLRALENAPPELAGDIVRSGIVLSGGGSLLRGLSERISRDSGLDVKVAENPMNAVATGARMRAAGLREVPPLN